MKQKIGNNKISNPSRTTQLEIKVKVLEEQMKALVNSTNSLLEQSGLRPIKENSPTGNKGIKYGD